MLLSIAALPATRCKSLVHCHRILGRVDKVCDPEPGRRDEDEAEIARGGLVVSGREAPAVLEL